MHHEASCLLALTRSARPTQRRGLGWPRSRDDAPRGELPSKSVAIQSESTPFLPCRSLCHLLVGVSTGSTREVIGHNEWGCCQSLSWSCYATDRWVNCPAASERPSVSTGGHLSNLIKFKVSHADFNLQPKHSRLVYSRSPRSVQ
jgi:hypothetical protein